MSARDIERISQLEKQITHLLEKVQYLSMRVVEMEVKKQQTLGLPKK